MYCFQRAPSLMEPPDTWAASYKTQRWLQGVWGLRGGHLVWARIREEGREGFLEEMPLELRKRNWAWQGGRGLTDY